MKFKFLVMCVSLVFLVDLVFANTKSIDDSAKVCVDSNQCAEKIVSKGNFPVGKYLEKFTYTNDKNKRVLNTIIWYPAKHLVDRRPMDGVFPVVIHTHGFPSSREEATYLYENLASHGFIVVSYDGPYSSMYSAVKDSKDIVQAPNDISFLIDSIEAMSDDPKSDFYGRVNKDQIGVSGVSYGAVISLLSAYVEPFKDDRVNFAVLVAPGEFPDITTKEYGKGRKIPLLYVQGSDDKLVSFTDVAKVSFKNAPEPKQFIGIYKGSHLGYVEETKDLMAFAQNGHIDSILCGLLAAEGDFNTEGCKKLGPAMHPKKQQDLLLLAASSFLRKYYSVDEKDRILAKTYFDKYLLKDNEELFD